MNNVSLLSALMVRMKDAGIVSLEGDFHMANGPALNVDKLDFFVTETFSGGTDRAWSTRRSRMRTVIVQYDLFVRDGTGVGLIEDKISMFKDAFDPTSETKCMIETDDLTAQVTRITDGYARTDHTWYSKSVIITLQVAYKARYQNPT